MNGAPRTERARAGYCVHDARNDSRVRRGRGVTRAAAGVFASLAIRSGDCASKVQVVGGGKLLGAADKRFGVPKQANAGAPARAEL